jgi:hypothetical protein
MIDDDFDEDRHRNIAAENLDIKTRLRMHLAMLSGETVMSREEQQVSIRAEHRAQVDAMFEKEKAEVERLEREEVERQERGYGGWA